MMRDLRRNRGAAILAGAALVFMAGCAENENILTGERLGVREILRTGPGSEAESAPRGSAPIALPGQQSVANWAQSPVSPHARVSNAAFSGAFAPQWSTSIGQGDSRRNRIIADPVVADGRIFTLDSASTLQATSLAGGALWSKSLVPLRDDAVAAQGGGMAVGGGRLYVTTGFGTLTAFDPETGAELWQQRLGAEASGAPTYRDGLVYVTSGDETGWAIEAGDGRVRWRAEGVANIHNIAGAPAPAVGDDLAIFSYGDGTLQAAFRQGGLRRWNATLSGRRGGRAIDRANDITGDPVIVGDTVYAGNSAGQTVALGLGSGERLWTADMGALHMPWVAGGSVFLVSDRNALVRLDAATGDVIWEVELPGWVPSAQPNRRRDRSFANYGPILAGNRLIVASSDGAIRAFSPENGALLSQVEIPGGATSAPVVAGGTLYVVSGNGVLHAFR